MQVKYCIREHIVRKSESIMQVEIRVLHPFQMFPFKLLICIQYIKHITLNIIL